MDENPYQEPSTRRPRDAKWRSALIGSEAISRMRPVEGLTWERWQDELVTLLRSDFCDALQDTTRDDVDWSAWEVFFLQGRSPRSAIERALERDI
jgi:hypothetical protein